MIQHSVRANIDNIKVTKYIYVYIANLISYIHECMTVINPSVWFTVDFSLPHDINMEMSTKGLPLDYPPAQLGKFFHDCT